MSDLPVGLTSPPVGYSDWLADLKGTRAFAEAWPGAEFVQQAAAQLSWGHRHKLVLLE